MVIVIDFEGKGIRILSSDLVAWLVLGRRRFTRVENSWKLKREDCGNSRKLDGVARYDWVSLYPLGNNYLSNGKSKKKKKVIHILAFSLYIKKNSWHLNFTLLSFNFYFYKSKIILTHKPITLQRIIIKLLNFIKL